VRRTAVIGGAAIPANTWTPVPFTTEIADPAGFHDNAVTPSRLIVPAGLGGTYLVWGSVVWGAVGASPNNWRIVGFARNGFGTDRILEEYNFNLSSGSTPGMAPSTVTELAAGDYVELIMYSPAATDIFYGASPIVQPRFGVVKLA
jgi:hypothetical protein